MERKEVGRALTSSDATDTPNLSATVPYGSPAWRDTQPARASVSRAIISSSSVGIQHTVTLLSSRQQSDGETSCVGTALQAAECYV